jgi:tyrosyl-tRNA synthetase
MAEKYNLLHTDQIGGRIQRFVIDAAIALTHKIPKGQHVQKITTALFMDVSGAFDNVSKDRLLQTL